MSLRESLLSIESWLGRLDRGRAVAALRSGAPVDAVRAQVTAAGLTSVASLEQLFGWHDGTDLPPDGVVDDVEIIPGFYFPAIRDAIAERTQYVDQDGWVSSWLPVLSNGAGYFYMVDLQGDADPVVLRWEIDAPGRSLAFSSLAAMASTLAQAYERGVFYVDDRGYLSMDHRRFENLGAELNPGAGAWQPTGRGSR